MAVLFFDGFGHYASSGGSGTNPAGLNQKYDVITPTPSIVAGGRNGPGIQIEGGEGIYKQLYLAVNTTRTVTTGFAVQRDPADTYLPTGNVSICDFYDGSAAQVTLVFSNTGLFRLYRGSLGGTLLAESTSAVDLHGFRYVEVRVRSHSSSGTFEIRVDGTAIALTTANPASSQNTGTGITGVRLIETGTDLGSFIFDDFYITDDTTTALDGTTTSRTGFLGDVKVSHTYTSGAGNYAQFTPSAGANYQNVDETPGSPCPDGDTTYNSHAATPLNERDSFAFTDISGIADPIAVQVCVSAKADETARGICAFTRIAGNDYDGYTLPVGTSSYNYCRNSTTSAHQIWEQNPNTAAAWLLTGVNGAEFGYKLVS